MIMVKAPQCNALFILTFLLVPGCMQADNACPPDESSMSNADSMLQLRSGHSMTQTRLGDDLSNSPCIDLQTPWHTNGKDANWQHGKMFFLDRDNVLCSSGWALSRFKVVANAHNAEVMIQFQCCPIPTSGTSELRHVTPNGAREDMWTFVNLPSVDCGSEGVVKSWKVTSNAGVDFTCAKVDPGQQMKCSDKQTHYAEAWGLNFLDRHALHCPEGQLMQSWDAHRVTFGSIRFSYRCCEIPPMCVDLHTPFNDIGVNGAWPNGQTFYLDRHDVRCDSKDGFGVSKFDFKTEKDNNGRMQVIVTCCQIPGGFQKGEAGKMTIPHGGDKTIMSRLIQNSAVDCGPDGVIQNWRVTHDSDVKYDCIKPNIKPSCSTQRTPTKHQKGVIQLNQHSVHCPEGQVMTKWDIGGGDEMFFEYTCCHFR